MFNYKTRTRLKDIEKRLKVLDNILLELTDVIDMAQNFDKRLAKIEGILELVRLNDQTPIDSILSKAPDFQDRKS